MEFNDKAKNTGPQNPNQDQLKDLDFLAQRVRNGRERQHVRDVNLIMAQRPRLRSDSHKSI